MPTLDGLVPWSSDWLWSLPLGVLTVMIHVVGLNLIRRQFHAVLGRATLRTLTAISILLMAGTTLEVTILHGIEASIWAFSFRWLGALPDEKTAMLYSLNAMTTFGHSGFNLEGQWHLMGALEALNGWILFGLSTAFLYGVNQRVWRMMPEWHHRTTVPVQHEDVPTF